MSLRLVQAGDGPVTISAPPGETSRHGVQPRGHAHFWERALARRQFIRTAAGTTAVVVGAGLVLPVRARASEQNAPPRPIPGGIQPFGPGTEVFHVFLPEPGNELSTITDFNGHIGAAEILGTGTATDAKTGAKTKLLFDADVRFMVGEYVGLDGRNHHGTFGFF